MGAWEDAKAAAEVRAGATSELLKRKLGSADLNREVQAQRSFGTTPLKPKAPDMPEFKDLGEKEPGATLGQAARARGIAKAQMNKSSSISHDAPHETDLHAGGKPWTPHTERGTAVATGSGEQAGAMMGVREQPKDLGRVTAKVARGEYGELSTKTAGAIKKGFMSRAASSIASKAGSALGVYGAVSLAAKASSALQGMKRGKVVDPMTLETHTPKQGETILTPTGKKKIMSGSVES